MFKKEKYYGKVWFVREKEKKSFCVLYMKGNDILLETDLTSLTPVYKEPQIIGSFTGLGDLTFVDCNIQFSQSGLTETRIYKPRYTFISTHHPIDAKSLKLQNFQVTNPAITQWFNYAMWYDMIDDKLIKKENVQDITRMDKLGLTITINHSMNIKTKRAELILSNVGYVSFELDNPIKNIKAFEIYNTFQKVMVLLSSNSAQYTNFQFQCLGCGEWANLYYNDYKHSTSSNNYIHIYYDDVREELPLIVNAAYENDSFIFCLNKLMENLLYKPTSHNKKFTNSISTFEAFGKLYSDIKPNKLKHFLDYFKDDFILLGNIPKDDFDSFAKKIIRSRDYHVHSNLKNKNIYTEFELLYISFLIDFVVGYGMLCALGISQKIRDKIIMKARSTYIALQKSNKILGSNSLTNEQY